MIPKPLTKAYNACKPGENNVLFCEDANLKDVISKSNAKKTMLTEWFEANRMYEDANELTYVQFPTYKVGLACRWVLLD